MTTVKSLLIGLLISVNLSFSSSLKNSQEEQRTDAIRRYSQSLPDKFDENLARPLLDSQDHIVVNQPIRPKKDRHVHYEEFRAIAQNNPVTPHNIQEPIATRYSLNMPGSVGLPEGRVSEEYFKTKEKSFCDKEICSFPVRCAAFVLVPFTIVSGAAVTAFWYIIHESNKND